MAKKKNKSFLLVMIFSVVCMCIITFALIPKEKVVTAGAKNEVVNKDKNVVNEETDNKKENKVEDKKEITSDKEEDPKEEPKEEVKEEVKEEEPVKEETPVKPVKQEELVNSTKNNKEEIEKIKEESSKSSNELKNNYSNVEKVVYDPGNNVIVIDPGHGNKSNPEKEPNAPGSTKMKIKDGGGATGSFSGTPEYVVAMDVSMLLKTKLEKLGYKVVMTKTSHDENPGNVERAMVGNEAKAALVIRMHADAYSKASAHGASVLTPEISEHTAPIYDESKRCAKILVNSMVAEAGMYNRGVVIRKDITGFNWSEVPVVLVEMGFMSNEKEDRLLNTPEYQEKIANGLAKGVMKALPIQEETEKDTDVSNDKSDESDEIIEFN